MRNYDACYRFRFYRLQWYTPQSHIIIHSDNGVFEFFPGTVLSTHNKNLLHDAGITDVQHTSMRQPLEVARSILAVEYIDIGTGLKRSQEYVSENGWYRFIGSAKDGWLIRRHKEQPAQWLTTVYGMYSGDKDTRFPTRRAAVDYALALRRVHAST